MEKLIGFKCTKCGRIKVGHKWMYLTEVEPPEHRAKLSWLIVVDGINWNFIHCADCDKPHKG